MSELWIEKAKACILNTSPETSIIIGADSIRFKKDNKWYARYNVVIVVHLDSKHGCKLFHKSEVLPDYGNLKQRLLTEVTYAIEAATEVIDVVGDRRFQVHLDLNNSPEHKSNVAVKEALGYVKGTLGIDAMIKPDAWAASSTADHIVRGKPL